MSEQKPIPGGGPAAIARCTLAAFRAEVSENIPDMATAVMPAVSYGVNE